MLVCAFILVLSTITTNMLLEEGGHRIQRLIEKEFRPRRPVTAGIVYVDEVLMESVAQLVLKALFGTGATVLHHIWFDTNSVYHRLAGIGPSKSDSEEVVAPEIVDWARKAVGVVPDVETDELRVRIAIEGLAFFEKVKNAHDLGVDGFLRAVETSRTAFVSLGDMLRREIY